MRQSLHHDCHPKNFVAGKSTVAAEMACLGAVVVDGDEIGHQVLRQPVVRRAVRKRWGAAVFAPGGQVDRAALAKIVFGAPKELAALNRILRPRIRRQIKREIAAARKSPAVAAIVLDAAILFDAGWDDLCSTVIFVRTPASSSPRSFVAPPRNRADFTGQQAPKKRSYARQQVHGFPPARSGPTAFPEHCSRCGSSPTLGFSGLPSHAMPVGSPGQPCETCQR